MITISPEALSKLYLEDHLTLRQIAVKLGCTRQHVHWLIKKNGIVTTGAEKFTCKCDVCGKDYITTRARFKRSVKHYCSRECYKSYLRNDSYGQSRAGQRLARKALEATGVSLKEGQVIHHLDGNCMNNELSNLRVFDSHSEHLKFHHDDRRGD